MNSVPIYCYKYKVWRILSQCNRSNFKIFRNSDNIVETLSAVLNDNDASIYKNTTVEVSVYRKLPITEIEHETSVNIHVFICKSPDGTDGLNLEILKILFIFLMEKQ